MKYMINKQKLFVAIFLVLVIVQSSLINTEIQITGILSTIIMVAEIILLIAYLGKRKYSTKVLAAILALLLLSVVTYVQTRMSAFMVMLILAVMIEKSDYEKVFVGLFKGRLLITFVVCMLSIIGVLDLYRTELLKSGEQQLIGYGLGYTHPNRLAYTAMYLILLYACIVNERMRIQHYFGVVLSALIVYAITKSRTLVICTGLLVCFLLFYKFKKTKRVFVFFLDKLSWIVPVLCAFLSIALPLLMIRSNGRIQEIIYRINGFMGSRFTHVYRAFLTYPITLFGGRTDFENMQDIYGYSTVDNGYIRLLYGFGILGFLAFILLTIISMRLLVKKKQYCYIIVIIVFLIWGISENVIENIAYNIAVLFWCEILKKYERGTSVSKIIAQFEHPFSRIV